MLYEKEREAKHFYVATQYIGATNSQRGVASALPARGGGQAAAAAGGAARPRRRHAQHRAGRVHVPRAPLHRRHGQCHPTNICTDMEKDR